MRGKTPPLFRGGHSDPALPHWPSFPGTQRPPLFLPGELPNGHASDSPDNTLACQPNSRSLSCSLDSDGKSHLAQPAAALHSAETCLPGTDIDPARRHRETHWVAIDAEPSLRWASAPAPCSPENRSPAQPSSRYCLAWCSCHRPPSVAAFSSIAVPRVLPPAITGRCRWLPESPRLPRSTRAPHRWKS